MPIRLPELRANLTVSNVDMDAGKPELLYVSDRFVTNCFSLSVADEDKNVTVML